MERVPDPVDKNISARKQAEIEADMETARKNGVHIDAAVNPFISEKDRQLIIKGLIQDPEWD